MLYIEYNMCPYNDMESAHETQNTEPWTTSCDNASSSVKLLVAEIGCHACAPLRASASDCIMLRESGTSLRHLASRLCS